MSTRYDVVQASENLSDSAQLHEGWDVHAHSENSNDSTPHSEGDQDVAKSEDLNAWPQHHKDEDVRTSTLLAQDDEQCASQPATVSVRRTYRKRKTN